MNLQQFFAFWVELFASARFCCVSFVSRVSTSRSKDKMNVLLVLSLLFCTSLAQNLDPSEKSALLALVGEGWLARGLGLGDLCSDV